MRGRSVCSILLEGSEGQEGWVVCCVLGNAFAMLIGSFGHKRTV